MLSWRGEPSALARVAGYRRGREAIRRLCGDAGGPALAAYARLVWGDEGEVNASGASGGAPATPPLAADRVARAVLTRAERRELQDVLRYHEAVAAGWAVATDERPDRLLGVGAAVPAGASSGPVDWAMLEDDLDAALIVDGPEASEEPPLDAEYACAQVMDGVRRGTDRLRRDRAKARRALREHDASRTGRSAGRHEALQAAVRSAEARLADRQAWAARCWKLLLPLVRATLAGEPTGARLREGRLIDAQGRDVRLDQIAAGVPWDRLSYHDTPEAILARLAAERDAA